MSALARILGWSADAADVRIREMACWAARRDHRDEDTHSRHATEDRIRQRWAEVEVLIRLEREELVGSGNVLAFPQKVAASSR